MNSSAALKAFVGEHGGAVCTSSNAAAILEWALARGEKVLFFPDQHLGRNTAYDMGYGEVDMRVWNPRNELGGLEERDVKESTFLLWKGHCSVHQRFRPEHIETFRAAHPDGQVVVHPECAHDVVELADKVGSTERILEWVDAAPPGAVLGIGTEIHMVQRMEEEHPDLSVLSLDPLVCPCSTMFRIDGPHLAWCLEALARGEVVNQIVVDDHTAEWARVALQRMLDLPGGTAQGGD
jgi:quinolinate synthase